MTLIRPVRPEDAGRLYEISAECSVSLGINKLAFEDIEGMRELIGGLTDRDHCFVGDGESAG